MLDAEDAGVVGTEVVPVGVGGTTVLVELADGRSVIAAVALGFALACGLVALLLAVWVAGANANQVGLAVLLGMVEACAAGAANDVGSAKVGSGTSGSLPGSSGCAWRPPSTCPAAAMTPITITSLTAVRRRDPERRARCCAWFIWVLRMTRPVARPAV